MPRQNKTIPTSERTPVPFGGGFVPIPNALFDLVLPTLKDTELRVLLIVMRQTWGWRKSRTAYVERDWISRALFCRRTGRASEAISGAVATLVEKELIAVEDTAGNSLATSEARRRHLGRLYYRPGDMWKTQ